MVSRAQWCEIRRYLQWAEGSGNIQQPEAAFSDFTISVTTVLEGSNSLFSFLILSSKVMKRPQIRRGHPLNLNISISGGRN